jgi:uncharacterized protein YggE
MTRRLCLLALAFAACGTAHAGPPYPMWQEPFGSPARQARTITVEGMATLDTTPDLMDVAMTVRVESKSPKTCVAGARKNADDLVKGMTALGLAKGDLELSQVNLGPTFDRETGVRTGYEASISIVAKTKSFDLIGDLSEAAANAGVTDISTSFERSDLPAQKAHVRDLALAAAKAKAEQTVKALGTALGAVDAVSESAGNYQAYGGVANNIEVRTTSGTGGLSVSATSLTMTIYVTWELQ